jgi:hypothetical protein
MKTARVTLLTSPAFKDFLHAEAQREGVSVAELIRSRCERRPTEEEAILAALTGELHKAVAESKQALKSGLDEAQAVLTELRAKRTVDGVLAPVRARRNREAGRARR